MSCVVARGKFVIELCGLYEAYVLLQTTEYSNNWDGTCMHIRRAGKSQYGLRWGLFLKNLQYGAEEWRSNENLKPEWRGFDGLNLIVDRTWWFVDIAYNWDWILSWNWVMKFAWISFVYYCFIKLIWLETWNSMWRLTKLALLTNYQINKWNILIWGIMASKYFLLESGTWLL